MSLTSYSNIGLDRYVRNDYNEVNNIIPPLTRVQFAEALGAVLDATGYTGADYVVGSKGGIVNLDNTGPEFGYTGMEVLFSYPFRKEPKIIFNSDVPNVRVSDITTTGFTFENVLTYKLEKITNFSSHAGNFDVTVGDGVKFAYYGFVDSEIFYPSQGEDKVTYFLTLTGTQVSIILQNLSLPVGTGSDETFVRTTNEQDSIADLVLFSRKQDVYKGYLMSNGPYGLEPAQELNTITDIISNTTAKVFDKKLVYICSSPTGIVYNIVWDWIDPAIPPSVESINLFVRSAGSSLTGPSNEPANYQVGFDITDDNIHVVNSFSVINSPGIQHVLYSHTGGPSGMTFDNVVVLQYTGDTVDFHNEPGILSDCLIYDDKRTLGVFSYNSDTRSYLTYTGFADRTNPFTGFDNPLGSSVYDYDNNFFSLSSNVNYVGLLKTSDETTYCCSLVGQRGGTGNNMIVISYSLDKGLSWKTDTLKTKNGNRIFQTSKVSFFLDPNTDRPNLFFIDGVDKGLYKATFTTSNDKITWQAFDINN